MIKVTTVILAAGKSTRFKGPKSKLEQELASGNTSKKDFVKKSKEYSSIGEIINEAKSYLAFKKEKEELEKIIEDKNSDREMTQLAKNELNIFLRVF